MQIKRFEAKDMRTALRWIKKELGPDAVILSARSLKKENKIIGRRKSVGVEVTAAVDGYHFPAEIKPALTTTALNTYRQNASHSLRSTPMRNSLQTEGSRIKTLYSRKRLHKPAKTTRSGNDDFIADVFQHLLSQEVKRDIANDIIDALKAVHPDTRFNSAVQVIPKISNILRQKRNGTEAPLRTASGCKVLAVVGPTGVGKTTTVAKLAARYVIERHKNVALISLDSDRVGGIGDLKVYAQAIGVPVKATATPSAFELAVKEFRKFDIVLVDTSGFNPRNQNQIDDIQACLDRIGAIEIHLALSATAKESDLLNAIKSVNTIDVQHLIFTKLDESGTCGNLINVLVQNSLPVSFVTNGREVPNDIQTGSMDKIVANLLSTFKNRKTVLASGGPYQSLHETPTPNEDRTFVANKNSDVFHRPECKWTRKIKSKNMITFSSIQTAKAQHFLPCRDCRPSRNSHFHAGLPASDKMQITN